MGVCRRRGRLGIVFERKESRHARKNILDVFLASNAFEEIGVERQQLLSGANLG